MTLPSAMGAVVVGYPTTSQTPLSGHLSPVFATVPIGFLVLANVSIGSKNLKKPSDLDSGRGLFLPGKEVGYIEPGGYFWDNYITSKVLKPLVSGSSNFLNSA